VVTGSRSATPPAIFLQLKLFFLSSFLLIFNAFKKSELLRGGAEWGLKKCLKHFFKSPQRQDPAPPIYAALKITTYFAYDPTTRYD
jgi:hypothetical protein